MEKNRKIETYLGFCQKAGKAILGTDRMETLKKSPRLILIDADLSGNSVAKIRKLQEKFGCPVLICGGEERLEDLLHRPGCKAVALSDASLAEAVRREAGQSGDFKLLQTVGNGGNR